MNDYFKFLLDYISTGMLPAVRWSLNQRPTLTSPSLGYGRKANLSTGSDSLIVTYSDAIHAKRRLTLYKVVTKYYHPEGFLHPYKAVTRYRHPLKGLKSSKKLILLLWNLLKGTLNDSSPECSFDK